MPVPRSPFNAGRRLAVTCRGRTFFAADVPIERRAAEAFGGAPDDAVLQFLDATLPLCARMIDCGAALGFMALYAATRVASVHAYEDDPALFQLLTGNLAINPSLARRITVRNVALGDHDGTAMLFDGPVDETVATRDARAEIEGLAIDARTLIKIDIKGAEYHVIPVLSSLLTAAKPFVHVSFHPFNITISDDPYVNAVARLRSALVVAESLAPYRFMYVATNEGWICIDPPSRLRFLRHYLLSPKQMPRGSTAYYGFTDSVGFSDVELRDLAISA